MLMTYLAVELGVVLISYWVFKLPKAQTLNADTKKVEMYCLSKPDVLLVEAVKTVLGIPIAP